MKKMTAPAMTALVFEGKTNMQNMLAFVGDKPKELFKEAIQNGLHPVGPQYWIYEWDDLKPNSDFNLKICLPVATFGAPFTNGVIKLQPLEPFMHVKAIHQGPLENMKVTYNQLMDEMVKHNMKAGSVCREVYMHCDFEQPENNITEIQFGIIN